MFSFLNMCLSRARACGVCVCVTHVYMHTRASDPLQECVQEHVQEWQKWREGVSWLESLFKVNPLEQDQRGRAEEEAEGASASSWPIHPHVHREASLPFFTFFSPGLCLSHCWKSLPYYSLLPVSNSAFLLTQLICPFGFRFNAPASMKPSLISQMWIRCPFVSSS